MADFVREVMTPGVVAVRPDASLVEAAQLMRAQDIGDVLVVTDQQVIGVLADRDITLRAVADGADPLTVSARAVCTPNPVMIGPDDAVSAAAAHPQFPGAAALLGARLADVPALRPGEVTAARGPFGPGRVAVRTAPQAPVAGIPCGHRRDRYLCPVCRTARSCCAASVRRGPGGRRSTPRATRPAGAPGKPTSTTDKYAVQ